mgnify:CR=1 FL=1
MNNFLVAAGVVAPLFVVIFLGYFLRRIHVISESFAEEANKLCFKVLLPCMLFYDIYSANITTAFDLRLMLFAFFAILIIFTVVWLLVTLLYKNNYRRGVIIQGMYRSNFIILGLPVATNIYGEDCVAVIGLLLMIVLPIYNILSIIALEIFNGKYQLEQITSSAHIDLQTGKRIFLQIIKNPLIIAVFLAFVLHIGGIALPKIVMQPLQSLAKTASTFSLMILGSFLTFSSVSEHCKELMATIAVKLVAVPAAALTAAVMMGFKGIELAALMAVFATPSATISFTMTKIIGGDSNLAANIVVFTSFISMFSLMICVYFLMHLGLIG